VNLDSCLKLLRRPDIDHGVATTSVADSLFVVGNASETGLFGFVLEETLLTLHLVWVPELDVL
jgi:hypothetical protein